MKRIVIFLICALVGMKVMAQTIPGYTPINDRYNWLNGYFKGLNIPAGATPSQTSGQTRMAGALFYDSTGIDSGLYVFDLVWQRMVKATELASYPLRTELQDTAAAIRADIGSGGADGNDSTLAQVASKGNVSDTILRTAGYQSNDTYGLIWSDNFTGGSLGANYVDLSASTETFTGAGLELDGTANVYTNLYARTDSTSEENHTEYLRFVVKEISADSYGVLVGNRNLNAHCCDHHFYGGVSLTNGTKTLRIHTEGSNFIYNDATTLDIAVNDTVEIWTTFEGWNESVSYYNSRTKFRHSFTLTGVPQGSVLPTTPIGFGSSALVHLGGNILVQNWSRYSNESKNAKNLWIGESLLKPGGNLTDPSQRLPHLVAKGNKSDVIIYGGGGSVAFYNRAGITSDFPRYTSVENVWLMGLGNDTLFSVYENQGKDAYRRIVNYWLDRGKRVIHVITTPRDALAMGQISTWVASEFPGQPIVNLYDRYRNGTTAFPAPWDAGDGVHWTKEFNIEAARYIDSLYPQYTYRNFTGEVAGNHGKFKKLSLTGQYKWDYTAATQTARIPNDASFVTIDPSSTLATFTLQLPYNVDSGHIVFIKFGGTLTTGVVVTALTVTADATQTQVKSGFVNYNNAVNAFGVGDWIVATYMGNNRWDVLPQQTYQYTDVTINGHGIGRGNLQTQQDNLRVGYFAGHSWATGASDNVAVGPSAQQLGTTGVRNTAVGNEALMNRQGASSNNTAVGEEALRNGTSGSGQTGVGHAAGIAATGADGVFVGINAGFDNTTAASNVFVGPNTGRGATTGGNNGVFGPNVNGLAAADNGLLVLGANGLRRIWVNNSGRVTLGSSITNTDTTNTNAWLKLPAGTARDVPLLFQSGTDHASPAAGMWYYNGTRLGFSPSTTIKRIALTNDAAPTNGQIPIGNGTDYTAANITSSGGSITVTNGAGTINLETALALASGEYTPTIDDDPPGFFDNDPVVTILRASYIRVGTQVEVNIYVSLTHAASATITAFGVQLPVASSLTSADQLTGNGTANITLSGASAGGDMTQVNVIGDATNDRAIVAFTTSSAGTHYVKVRFAYTIL